MDARYPPSSVIDSLSSQYAAFTSKQAQQAVPSPSPTSIPNNFYTTTTIITPTATSVITSQTPDHQNAQDFWQSMSKDQQLGIIATIIIGTIIIVCFSIWFCCGCCGIRARRRRSRFSQDQQNNPHAFQNLESGTSLPLATVQTAQSRTMARNDAPPPPVSGEAPPPMYEQVVPPSHRFVAGGMQTRPEEDDDMGVISDGKTPLSEIPFEDVVLDQVPSSSSSSDSQQFGQRHHGFGDTTGHTNS